MGGELDLRADEELGKMIYRALYEHEGGKWDAVETRYVWYNAGARLRKMLNASTRRSPDPELEEALESVTDWLDDARSPYIPSSASNDEWNVEQAKRVNRARALLSRIREGGEG